MCELCKGTHIVAFNIGFGHEFGPCPDCGTKSQEAIDQEWQTFQTNLFEAKAKFEAEGHVFEEVYDFSSHDGANNEQSTR